MTRPTLDSDAMSRPRYGTVHADAMARDLLDMHQDAPHKAVMFLAALMHNLAAHMERKAAMDALLQKAAAQVASMTDDERKEMLDQQRASWVCGELGLGLDADERASRDVAQDARKAGL